MIVEDPELLALKRRELALEKKKSEIMKANRLAFYKPHLKQQAFHESTAKRRMVRAGNRFGKSMMGVAEDASWLLGYRPWYPEGDPRRTAGIPQRPVKLLVITTDWDKVDEIFTSERGELGKLLQFLPKGFVKGKRRNHSGAIDTVECINGSIIRFDTVKSFMANPQGSESSDWDAVHIDEPCPEDMWKAVSRGLIDRNGSAWFTLTPLTEFWINDLFFPQDTAIEQLSRDNYWAITGQTRDNPYLSKEAIDEFEASLTEDEKQCRLYGVPLELSGLVYKEFKFEKHVLREPPKTWNGWKPPKEYLIQVSIDPHPQTPHAVLFVAIAPTGQKFLYDEIFHHCSIGELSVMIKERTKGYHVSHTKCDPMAWINDPITESCIAEEFFKHGVFVEKSSKSKSHGILKVKAELQKDNNIYVNVNMKQFLFEIHRYCYDKENKPRDKDDHLMEAMYRVFINDPVWYDPNELSIPIKEADVDRDLTLGRLVGVN